MKGRPKAIVSEFPDRTAARAVPGWKPSAETIGTTNAILKSAATSGVSMSSGFSSLMKSARRQVLPKLRVLWFRADAFLNWQKDCDQGVRETTTYILLREVQSISIKRTRSLYKDLGLYFRHRRPKRRIKAKPCEDHQQDHSGLFQTRRVHGNGFIEAFNSKLGAGCLNAH